MLSHDESADVRDLENFWRGKTSCWETMSCPESIRADCPAPHHRQYPCWEIEGTYCKWDGWGNLGIDTSLCLICQVYLKWGGGRPIELKLWGKGIKLIID